MTAGNFGPAWVTDADRTSAYDALQAAYAAGRLDQAEFDRRTAAVSVAQTRDQLAAVTAGLPGPGLPGSFQASPGYPGTGFQGPDYPGQPASYQGRFSNQPWLRGVSRYGGTGTPSSGIGSALLAILAGPAYFLRMRRGGPVAFARPRMILLIAIRLILIGIVIYVATAHRSWLFGSSGG